MYKRGWLNKNEGMAAIVVRCKKDPSPGWYTAALDLSDCNRKVSIDLDFIERTREDKLAKLDTIIQFCELLKTSITKVKFKSGDK